MKTIIFAIAIASLLVVVSIFTGFPSPAEKADEAQNKLQEAKIGLKFALASANEVAKNESKLEASKTEIWECELAIQDNKNHIIDINSRLTNDGSVLNDLYENRIRAIEMKNYQLEKRIAVIENEQSRWEQLKRELSKDLDKFGKSMYALVFEKRD